MSKRALSLAIAILIILLFVTCIAFGISVSNGYYQYSTTITVTDKQTYGHYQMRVFDGINQYRAPGYLWDEIKVGSTYNISGTDIPIFGDDGPWITTIEEYSP